VTAVDEETSYLYLGPTRVRVRCIGTGPPLLMLMGIGGNLDMWRPLADLLGKRRLIMFDFPGTGSSGQSFLPPTMGCNALFVKLLLRRLDLPQVDVLGYSWGGLLAQHLAVQHPASVRRLVLACTTVGLGGVPPSPAVAARMLTPRRYYSRNYFTRVAPTIYGGKFRTDPTLSGPEAARRISRPPSIRGYTAQLAALAGYSTLPVLPFLSAPTLILAGSDDPIVSTFNPRLLARFIRHSTLNIIPEAGHLLLLESPEKVGPLIDTFLTVD
jgi:poly(3-hydroxyoctanoate) depolymerase